MLLRHTQLSLALLASFPALAADEVLRTAPIVVSATRIEQSSFDAPAAIDVLDQSAIGAAQWQVNASESLARVPGVFTQNRQTYSQDLQVSVRGFGARSQFGIRGLRVIADDIPASMPDGQGSTGSFSLASAERIEVLRGPQAALYGNHSGGVLQLFTRDGPARPTLDASYGAGSYGSARAGLQFGGQRGDLNYNVDTSRFQTEGWRDHSAARRNQANAKLRWTLDERSTLSFVASYLDQPENQDPLGLSAAQMRANPRQVDTSSATNPYTMNTRRSLSNAQGGLVYERRMSDADTLRAVVYAGARKNIQYLAIPLATQNAATHSGGISLIDRDFGGLGLRWTHRWQGLTLTTGADWEDMADTRKGYLNNFGQIGGLKRDEDNLATSLGLYAQLLWEPAPDWSVSGGVRASRVRFSARDRYVVAGNGDDSGSATYSAVTPSFGVLHKLTSSVNLYANVGRSFETPTFVEMAYRPDGSSGLNFNLQPSTSVQAELGLKAYLGPATRLNAAVFQIDTRNEVVIARSGGGRNSYQNAGRSQRRGLELGVDSEFGGGWSVALSYTLLDARYRESFRTCNATPCNVATGVGTAVAAAGNRIPGVPRNALFAELAWAKPALGLSTALEVRQAGVIYVDDRNSEAADAYTLLNWRIGFEQKRGDLTLKQFLRIDNLGDKPYVGAVYVGDANGRYYAPGVGRNLLAGISLSQVW